jgi:hypothetical protein
LYQPPAGNFLRGFCVMRDTQKRFVCAGCWYAGLE